MSLQQQLAQVKSQLQQYKATAEVLHQKLSARQTEEVNSQEQIRQLQMALQALQVKYETETRAH